MQSADRSKQQACTDKLNGGVQVPAPAGCRLINHENKMDDNNSSGLGDTIGTLALGAGLAAWIMLPFYILWRFGLHYVLAICAPISTIIAIYQTDLLAEFDGNYGSTDQMLHAYFSLPWTALAVINWGGLVLMVAAVALDVMPSVFAGSEIRAARKAQG